MKLRFLTGCYTDTDHPHGLHLLELDLDQKSITLIRSHQLDNPSYLAFSAKQSIVYTVNENHGSADRLSAIKFNADLGIFNNLNQVSAKGIDPCYISIDHEARHVFAANYSDGTLCCAPIKKDGRLDEPIQLIKHHVDEIDVQHPNTHMHAAVLSPDEKFLLATNLGQDTISIYKYSPDASQPLAVENVKVFTLPNGTGPRHLCFSRNQDYCYVVGELDGSVHVLQWKLNNLTLVQSQKLMADDDVRKNSAADLHLGTSGEFLYVSNRGDINMLIIFKIDQQNGKLELIGRTHTNGLGPRNFAIAPNGGYMLIAHQYSNTIRLFEIDQISGQIQDTGVYYQLHSPVCLKFL